MRQLGHLFSPIEIRGRVVKNRIVSTAHATGYDNDGLITEQEIAYQERKAAGGAGIVMTFGSAGVSPASLASYGSMSLWRPDNDPALRDLASRVHRHGTLLLAQATHMGRRGSSARDGGALMAPSPIPEPVHRETPHEMTLAEIDSVIESFAACARRLEACGWDGMEITSFGGHLIEQFFSPVANRRRDRYGGSFDNRLRFAVNVVGAVAAAVSRDFILSFRLTGDPLTDAVGLDGDDMLSIAQRLAELRRIDLFNVSGGTGATLASQAATVPSAYYPPACYNHLARRFREHLPVPVMVAGRILDPAQAERAIAEGDCDLVAMTRAIIADPDLPVRAQAGSPGLIRPCISINEECIGRLYQGLPIRCAVNPAAGAEHRSQPSTHGRPRRVVVAGGGPAGMEAACQAARCGHQVTLLEREGEVGGQLKIAALAPERPLFSRYTAWLRREAERLKVDLRMGVEATVKEVTDLDPDVVIVATGSQSVVPPEGQTLAVECVTDVDLLLGQAQVPPGATVLVYDIEGRARGGSIALWAAAAGAARVELVTDLVSICEELDPTQKPSIYRLLAQRGVICRPSQALAGARNGFPVFADVWSGELTTADTIDLAVFVGYRRALAGLAGELEGQSRSPVVHLIGDALAPRRLYDAVAEGFAAGTAIAVNGA